MGRRLIYQLVGGRGRCRPQKRRVIERVLQTPVNEPTAWGRRARGSRRAGGRQRSEVVETGPAGRRGES